MGTTAEKLQKILESKAAIKAAIEGKGVSDVGDVLSAYAGKIEAIKTGSDIKNQDKVVEITQNGQEVVTADEGYTGLGKVTVNTNVPSSGGNVQGFLYLKEGVKSDFKAEREVLSIELPDNMDNVTNMSSCFAMCASLTQITLPDLPKVNSMAYCFSGCSRLVEISLGNISVVTDLMQCFDDCYKLSSITIPEMPNLQSAYQAFWNCSSLTDINLPESFPALTNMNSMFKTCGSITSISLPKLPSAKNMEQCFAFCYKLESISLPEIPNVTSLEGLLKECSSLKAASFPSLLNVSNVSYMFNNCTSLQMLTVSALPNINLTNWGISTCTALTKESLENIVRALPVITVRRTCTLGTTNLSKLDENYIYMATEKGWTLN